MRKIDKKCPLSTVYQTWESNLTGDHPTYSSQGKFYKDIVTQLLHNQDGLCAFTERRLCDEKCYDKIHWKEGRYKPKKPVFEGDLDHFNPLRKKQEGWAWDNFLVAFVYTNMRIKGAKEVDDILKPNHPDYNEFEVLAYNPTTNRFTPNPKLTAKKQVRVQIMLGVLGINSGPTIRLRKEYLTDKFKLLEVTDNVNEVTINQFPTAYEMTRILKESNTEGSILDSL